MCGCGWDCRCCVMSCVGVHVVLVVCVCGVVWCVWHAETSSCARSKRPRVYRHHAHMCFNTCARGASIHGDVLNVHTGGGGRWGHRQFCLPKFAHVGLSRVSEVQQRNPCMSPIFSLRIGREQHVAESSIYSLHLNTLFNSRHMTQRHSTEHAIAQKQREEKKR